MWSNTEGTSSREAGVGGWLDPLDGWTPGPSILGQMDTLDQSVLGWMDSSLDGWTSLASSDRTLTVSNALDQNAISDALDRNGISNTLDRCQ